MLKRAVDNQTVSTRPVEDPVETRRWLRWPASRASVADRQPNHQRQGMGRPCDTCAPRDRFRHRFVAPAQPTQALSLTKCPAPGHLASSSTTHRGHAMALSMNAPSMNSATPTCHADPAVAATASPLLLGWIGPANCTTRPWSSGHSSQGVLDVWVQRTDASTGSGSIA